jgi:hypothetical protein
MAPFCVAAPFFPLWPDPTGVNSGVARCSRQGGGCEGAIFPTQICDDPFIFLLLINQIIFIFSAVYHNFDIIDFSWYTPFFPSTCISVFSEVFSVFPDYFLFSSCSVHCAGAKTDASNISFHFKFPIFPKFSEFYFSGGDSPCPLVATPQ